MQKEQGNNVNRGRCSFRKVFLIGGPGLLLVMLISLAVFSETASLDRTGPVKAVLLEDVTPQSSTGDEDEAVNGSGKASEADDALTVEVEKTESQSTDLEWLNSSYFDTVLRDEKINCPKVAAMTSWNGRLGNHIHQILNLLLFAHLCSTNEVYFPKHQDNLRGYSHQIGLLDMPTALKFQPREDIWKHPRSCPKHAAHTHAWFGNFCITKTPMWIYHQLAVDFVRPHLGEYVQECLNQPEDKDAQQTLTVHMRADDVWKYPDYSWGQPPCSMYEKIIKENKFTKILFVKKGRAPCAEHLLAVAEAANILVEYPPRFDASTVKKFRMFYRDAHDVATDFCYLIRARHLVLSFSTFAVSAALLSTSVQTLYRRREADWEHYLKSPGLNCNPWPAVTMYDYSFELPKNKTRHGSEEWLKSYPMERISGPTKCTYGSEQ